MKKQGVRFALNQTICRMISFIIVFILTTSTAFAATSSKKEVKPEIEVLTVEKAVRFAINNSSDLKKAEEDNYIATQNHDTLLFNMYSASTEEEAVKAAIALTKNEMQTSLSYPNIENKKKSLELTITRYFSTIISVERSLELYDKKLELDKRELEITKVKAELGLVSAAALETANFNYEKSVSNRATKVKAIDDAYKNLALIMGVSDMSKYKIELDFTYKTLKEINLSSYIEEAYKTNLKLIQAEEDFRVAKYEHSISKFDSDLTEESSKLKLTQKERDIADIKTNLSDTITKSYNDIRSLELSYELKLLDYTEMEKQLKIKQVQLELGKATQIEIDKYEYDMQNSYNVILDDIADHEYKVMQFLNTQLL